MSKLTTKVQSTKELGREVKRTTRRSQRDIQREITALDRQEKALTAEIKKAAKSGSKKLLNTYAKQLLQVRKNRERLNGVSHHLSAVGTQAQLMASNASAMNAVSNTAAIMGQVNKAINPTATAAMLQSFEREMTKMAISEDQMNEFLEDAFDEDGVEEEADELVAETLAGIGIEIGEAMKEAPSAAPALAPAVDYSAALEVPATVGDTDVDDLEARLASPGDMA